MSLKDGAVPFMPKIVTYKQLGFSELGNNLSRSLLGSNGISSNNSRGLKHGSQTPTTTAMNGGGNGVSKKDILSLSTTVQQQSMSLLGNSNGGTPSVSLEIGSSTSKQHYSWSPSSSQTDGNTNSCNNSNNGTSTVIFDQHNTKLVLSSRSAFSTDFISF